MIKKIILFFAIFLAIGLNQTYSYQATFGDNNTSIFMAFDYGGLKYSLNADTYCSTQIGYYGNNTSFDLSNYTGIYLLHQHNSNIDVYNYINGVSQGMITIRRPINPSGYLSQVNSATLNGSILTINARQFYRHENCEYFTFDVDLNAISFDTGPAPDPFEGLTCETKYINYSYPVNEGFTSPSINEYNDSYVINEGNNIVTLTDYNSFTGSLVDVTNGTGSFTITTSYNPFSNGPFLQYQFENPVSTFLLEGTGSFETFTTGDPYTVDQYYTVGDCENNLFQNYELTQANEKYHFEFGKRYNLDTGYNKLCFRFNTHWASDLQLTRVNLGNNSGIQVEETLFCSDNETGDITIGFDTESGSDLETYTGSLNDLGTNGIDVIENDDEASNSYTTTTGTGNINYTSGCKVPIGDFGTVKFNVLGFGEVKPFENYACLFSTIGYYITPIVGGGFETFFGDFSGGVDLIIGFDEQEDIFLGGLKLGDLVIMIAMIMFAMKFITNKKVYG